MYMSCVPYAFKAEEVHVVLNCWFLLGFTRYLDHASCKLHGNVLCFVKALDFQGEITEQFDAYNFTRLVT